MRAKQILVPINDPVMINKDDLSSISPSLFAQGSALSPLHQTAYFVFIMRMPITIRYDFIRWAITSSSVNNSSIEVGLFYTTKPPNGASQTLIKIAYGTPASALGTGIKVNQTALRAVIREGTYLWYGYYNTTSNASAGSALYTVGRDLLSGRALTTASATAFSAGSTWTGSIITGTAAVNTQAPYLEVSTF